MTLVHERGREREGGLHNTSKEREVTTEYEGGEGNTQLLGFQSVNQEG